MLKKQFLNVSAVCLLAAASSAVMAHLNIAQENVFALGDNPREYVEGSSAFINVNLPHDCSDADGNHYATTDVEVLLPNGTGIAGAFTSNHSTGDVFGANAVMGVKQRMNQTFEKNIVMKDTVDAFYSHGLRTEDARVMKWLEGEVDNDHYDNLEFKAGFPKIDPESCITKIELFFPSVQYCKSGFKTAWIGVADSKFGLSTAKTRVTERYAAHFSIVRSQDNPLPASCGGVGETVEARPSTDEIDSYLDLSVDHD